MTTTARVRRLPVIDEYVEDGRSAVLVEGHALTLSEIATYVLSCLGEEWSAYDALVATVEAEVGAPAEGSTSEALEQVLRDLAGHRLVELDDSPVG
ncbi:hypothetical protein [Nocardioides jishulii]|uniref:PqqD family protein n=1 Tax=Nocardioides jishulii TaxID=2575440 RepID=A0A4U2YH01_9ACTN|nr:hypothetical protein [Nocardioides jishulii]QCX26752.1 hypothetical protein FCL41_03725 [Nocardioides jishulii]TKI60278.1 hypothetical protein FC770_15825 [Nocardioides jishulii]